METLSENARTLHDSLLRIVGEFEQGRYLETTTSLDVFFAYRLLLLRNAEPSMEALDARTSEFPHPEFLSRGFMASNEFRARHHGRSERPDGRIVVVRDGDLRIAVHLDDACISQPIINGQYEPETRRAVDRLVREGDVCLDLGANLGYVTALMAGKTGPRGRVISYEPFPTVIRLLEITVGESGFGDRVEIRRRAASDAAGQAELIFAAESDNFGGSYLAPHAGAAVGGLSSVIIDLVALDEDLAGVPPVSFMKMDIEGAEPKALRGMQNRLRADRPLILSEMNPQCLARQGSSPDEMLSLLTGFGYDVFRLADVCAGRAGKLLPGSEERFGDFEDILCVPPDRVQETLARLAD